MNRRSFLARLGGVIGAALGGLGFQRHRQLTSETPHNDTVEIAGRCDTCGEPATALARDSYEVTMPGDTIDRYELGPIKRGCAEHPPGARCFQLEPIGNGDVWMEA